MRNNPNLHLININAHTNYDQSSQDIGQKRNILNEILTSV